MRRRDFCGLASAAAMTPTFGSANNGFHVPAEEEPHQRTFMQWPVNRQVYRDRVYLEMTQRTIADIANTIAAFEPVVVMAHPYDQRNARKWLSENVEIWDIPTEDLWCRDAGPIFAKGNDGLVVSHIQFNGWGEKQVNTRDSQIAAQIARHYDLPLVPSGLKGEAGGVEQDGHGLLMAHESSWMIDNRNPGLSRQSIEDRLLNAYGATEIIWAPGVWDQDITDYHIDSLARFTGPGRVLINMPVDLDPDDPFHLAAQETLEILRSYDLEIDLIPEPMIRRVDSFDFVASYANYYVCNGAVIAAQFGDAEADAIAQDALRRHYPGREVVVLNVDPLGELGGGIHCATQQMPA